MSGYQIALWYYWRWLIETYFKLLKSHGQEMENWQQQTGLGIARRALIASMACVQAWRLQRDQSPEALQTREVLTRLSGRSMKHGRISTAPALLAGLMILFSTLDLLGNTDVDIGQLESIAQTMNPFDSS